MIAPLSQLLSRFFLKHDPKVLAFNNFYRELISSSLYQEISQDIHGHSHAAYNLCDNQTYTLLKEELKGLDSVTELGCGTGIGLKLFCHHHEKTPSYIGFDFSEVALAYAKKVFPQATLHLHHQNFPLPIKSKREGTLAIDSLYPSGPHHSLEETTKTFKKALSKTEKTLILVQNFYPQRGEDDFLPHLEGWQRRTIDLTPGFKQIIASWQEALQRPEVKDDRKNYPLLWGTISQEIAKHQRSLNESNESPNEGLRRYLVRYDKGSDKSS